MIPTRLGAAFEKPSMAICSSRLPTVSTRRNSVSQEWEGSTRVASCHRSITPGVSLLGAAGEARRGSRAGRDLSDVLGTGRWPHYLRTSITQINGLLSLWIRRPDSSSDDPRNSFSGPYCAGLHEKNSMATCPSSISLNVSESSRDAISARWSARYSI